MRPVFLVVLFFFPVGLNAQTCLHFDGQQNVTAVVEIPAGSIDFTIEARFKSQSQADFYGMSRLICWNSGQESRIEIGNHDGFLTLYQYPDDEGLVETREALQDSLWHHVAYVREGNVAKLYMDGRLLLTKAAEAKPGRSLIIGSWYEGRENWRGCIDEVRLWKVARTEAQISTYQAKKIPKRDYKQLLAYYQFDEGRPNADNTRISRVKDTTGKFPGILNKFRLTGSDCNFVGENQAFPAPPPILVQSTEEPTSEEPENVKGDVSPPVVVNENGCTIKEALLREVFFNTPLDKNFETVHQFFQTGKYRALPRVSDGRTVNQIAIDSFLPTTADYFYQWSIQKSQSFITLHSNERWDGKRSLKMFEAYFSFSTHEQAERCAFDLLNKLVKSCEIYARYFPINDTHYHYFIVDHYSDHCFQYGVHYSTIDNKKQFVQLTFSKMQD